MLELRAEGTIHWCTLLFLCNSSCDWLTAGSFLAIKRLLIDWLIDMSMPHRTWRYSLVKAFLLWNRQTGAFKRSVKSDCWTLPYFILHSISVYPSICQSIHLLIYSERFHLSIHSSIQFYGSLHIWSARSKVETSRSLVNRIRSSRGNCS